MFESGTERGAKPVKKWCAVEVSFCFLLSSAWVAQLVERVLGKDEVTGSIPVSGSSLVAAVWFFDSREREDFLNWAGVTQR